MIPAHTQQLTARQERFILAYLTSDSQEQAAKACGVGHKTACRWMKQPVVQAAIGQARKRTFEKALQQLQAYAVEAAKVLRVMMLNPKVADGTRVRAALGILEHAAGAHLLEEFAERVEQLEASVREQERYQRAS